MALSDEDPVRSCWLRPLHTATSHTAPHASIFFCSHLWMSALEVWRSTIWARFPKPLAIYSVMLINAYLYVEMHFFFLSSNVYLSCVCGICETESSMLCASHSSHPPELPQHTATYLSALLLAGNELIIIPGGGGRKEKRRGLSLK